ncbi:MAG: aminotransferase class I/II-fold pyridoxal phosphate-dependent enzyme [Armatimonadota bacterium]|nr:aminotransferase class I/II-fold pyridoxal phosphate-dependent enzyme [Armatimonadota bacterium]MDR5697979.1 aminotransferase class I/II-fold pyridoxal phosphate-dependent enzyme [Armatimonadota bacterium]
MARTAQRVSLFQESVIREMTRLNNLHGGINLAQGFPDFDPPTELLEAAKRALDGGVNQYAITWGAPNFRAALSEKMAAYNGVEYDSDRHITVTCGATEGMMAALLATVNPGDEVIVFEPFYENYGPDAVLSGASLRYVPLDCDRPGCPFDLDELRGAFGPRTKAVIVNTPHNPTGKVFTREELRWISELCIEYDALAITDEVYEHILYDGADHVSIASLPGMAERTITVNSMSKTYSVTGWRVGWVAIRDEDVTMAVRRAHDFLTVGAPAPLQEAGITALRFPAAYYQAMADAYRAKRDLLLSILSEVGFRPLVPRGAYYIMAGIERFGFGDDVAFAHHLVREVGVATVPGSSFFHDPALGRRYIRFAFPKRESTLRSAGERLRVLPERI